MKRSIDGYLNGGYWAARLGPPLRFNMNYQHVLFRRFGCLYGDRVVDYPTTPANLGPMLKSAPNPVRSGDGSGGCCVAALNRHIRIFSLSGFYVWCYVVHIPTISESNKSLNNFPLSLTASLTGRYIQGPSYCFCALPSGFPLTQHQPTSNNDRTTPPKVSTGI